MTALRVLGVVSLLAVGAIMSLAPTIADSGAEGAGTGPGGVVEYLKCSLCETPRLTGELDDCCCNIETVDETNREHFLPILRQLTKRTYFRYFQADLWKNCEFWADEGTCMTPHCSVCECDPNELPKPWLALGEGLAGGGEGEEGCGNEELGRVTFGGDWEVGRNFTAWRLQQDADMERDDDLEWTVSDSSNNGKPKYINLLENPERYTGYSGPDAARVWRAIGKENCFTEHTEDVCLEERVFGRVLSGLQTSISSHLSTKYAFGPDQWGPNVDLYVARVGRHREWLKNLHFLFIFMVRALAKASEALKDREFFTGNDADDALTKDLFLQLSNVEVPNILRGFDESKMFQVRSEDLIAACPATLHGLDDIHELQHRFLHQQQLKVELKNRFRAKFRNISRILNCVTCEKCRLWGKLQFLGVGTALKILFTPETDAVSLSKNELVAFVNVLHQVSTSVYDVQRMRDLEAKQALQRGIMYTIALIAVCGAIAMVVRRARKRRALAASASRASAQSPGTSESAAKKTQ